MVRFPSPDPSHHKKVRRNEMLRTLKLVNVCAAFALMAGSIQSGTINATEHKWKVQNLYGPNTTVYKDFQTFTARVKEATKGEVDIQAFPVATIVPQAEALDAIK